MHIRLVSSVVRFEHRFCWLLSSLLQQTGNLPRISVDMAFVPKDGSPPAEEVSSFFSKQGLEIIETPLTMEEIQYRGHARNVQLKKCDADWVLFIDADMVYSPGFFSDLAEQLRGPLKDETKCLSARRVSLDKQHCKDFFNSQDPWIDKYPCVIPDPSDYVKDWPVFQMSANVGAGYFQLANVANIRENHGGIYVPEDSNPDWGWLDGKKMQKARSDKVFRRNLGGITKIKTEPQYHLNHERDNEEGCHITLQR